MALSEDVKAKWYQALFEEDCIAVMNLLETHPRLLKVGGESEPARQVEGRGRRQGSKWTKSTWNGRNALHVAASRGCVKLVIQVLRLCKVPGMHEIDGAYQQRERLLEQFSFSSSSSSPGRKFFNVGCDVCGQCPIRRRWWMSNVQDNFDLCSDCYGTSEKKEDYRERTRDGTDSTFSATNPSLREASEATAGQSADCAPDAVAAEGKPQKGPEPAQMTKRSESVRVHPAARKFRRAVSSIIRESRQEMAFTMTEQETGISVSDMDFHNLVWAKDGTNGLTVVGIAALHGNVEIIDLIDYDLELGTNNYTGKFGSSPPIETIQLLRQTIVKEIDYDDFREDYHNHRDFNFLPPEEYLFHFIFAEKNVNWGATKVRLWRAIRSCEEQLWRFVLELKDGQGRTPFNVAMYESMSPDFVDLMNVEDDPLTSSSTETRSMKEFIICAMTVPDGVGRTPIHRAAASNLYWTVKILLEFAEKYVEVAATCHVYWRCDVSHHQRESFDGISYLNGFSLDMQLPHTPVHAAIIHGSFSVARLLIEKWVKFKWGELTYRSIDIELVAKLFRDNDIPAPRAYTTEWGQGYNAWIEWDVLEFACLAGAHSYFISFLIDVFKIDLNTRQPPNVDDLYDEKRTDAVVLKHLWHPLHLVASSGKYHMLKYFIDNLQCSPFLEDYDGNSSLHHAMKVTEFELATHLLDYVDPDHVIQSKAGAVRFGEKKVLDDISMAERQGCINRLLQAGCAVFKANNRNELPYPSGSISDAKFLSWWYEKQEKEFNATQSNLNFATNAIAVTATLVATASYVGPLQPPMGYNANQIQYENAWVSIFIVCDTLSFYLAIVAITLSLIPALPMPDQAMREELQRTRGMVIYAVGILLPSIFFVFLAFASSSISVMSANITSEVGGILTIVSILLGIISCFLAFALFSIRLLAFIYPQKVSIRYVYNLSTDLLYENSQLKRKNRLDLPAPAPSSWTVSPESSIRCP